MNNKTLFTGRLYCFITISNVSVIVMFKNLPERPNDYL